MTPRISLLILLLALPSAADPQPAAPAVFTNVGAPEAIERVRRNDATKADPKHIPLTVLDVRTPAEFAQAHIGSAKNLDFHSPTFKDELGKLDRSKPYLVHCATGNRSAKVRDLMKTLGFTDVAHLNGGLRAWTAAGGAVVRADKPSPASPRPPVPAAPKQ